MTISPNPLPNPDLTDTSYMQQHHNKINMTPSILENIRDARDGYEDSLYGRRNDYPDKYGSYKPPSHYGSEKDYPGGAGGASGSQTIGHLRSFHPDAAYLSDNIYDKQRTLGSGYLGAKSESPYLSKDRITPDIYGSRDGHYSLKRQPGYATDSLHSVHSLLKNDYQQQQQQLAQQADRLSEGSDKNGYHFPYTAEEDHLQQQARKLSGSHMMHPHIVNDMNNPGLLARHTLNGIATPGGGIGGAIGGGSSRHSSRASSPPSNMVAPMQPLGPLASITDTE